MDGYTCAGCGQWVGAGYMHVCSFPPTTVTVTVSPSPGELLIAAALERIALALECVAGRPGRGRDA